MLLATEVFRKIIIYIKGYVTKSLSAEFQKCAIFFIEITTFTQKLVKGDSAFCFIVIVYIAI